MGDRDLIRHFEDDPDVEDEVDLERWRVYGVLHVDTVRELTLSEVM